MASTEWEFAAVVEVPQQDRIQCQCNGCGHVVYKRIHIILWGDGRIECWGQDCFERELGVAGKATDPWLGGSVCRRLTDEERGWLLGNRDRLIERFRAEVEERRKEHRERQEVFAAVVAKPRSAVLHTAPVTDEVNPPPLPGEPMKDPKYVEIRARVIKQFAEFSDEFRHHFRSDYWRQSVVDNARKQFNEERRR